MINLSCLEVITMEQLMSLSKIFSEKIFRIPDYQRGYAWTKKEIEEFWSDLCRLGAHKNHYVGVLTLEPVSEDIYKSWIDDTWIIESKKYSPYYVVDGQQRLTTSIILIHTILEIMKNKEIAKLNYTSEDQISEKFVYESKNENYSRTYIFGYEYNNPSYEYLIVKIFHEKPQKSINTEETIYTLNLEYAKYFFYEKLDLLSIDQLEDIYTKITQNFLFNIYIISSDIDVHVTFETMNNRGKPLSHLELLKNRLIYLSTLFESKEDDKSRLRRNINTCWKDIYHSLGRNREKKLLDDEFLVTHFMFYFCRNIKDIENNDTKHYYKEFGEWQNDYLLNKYFIPVNIIDKKLAMTECFDYIENLRHCIALWECIKNPMASKKLSDEVKEYIDKINVLSTAYRRYSYSMNFINNDYYINVFLLACFQVSKNDETLLRFLKALEKYLFVLCFFDNDAIREIDINLISFYDIVIKLNKGDMVLQGVIDKLSKTYSQIVGSEDLMNKTILHYNKFGFYHNDWVRYFLCEYEVSLMKKSKSNISKIDTSIFYKNGYKSIEHIYPANSHNKYWLNLYSKYNSNQRNKLKDSLGNFVAISDTKNSKLGNLPFPEKKSNMQNTLGYKYGTYAEIELTEYEDWSAKEILGRGLRFTTFLWERWGIRIGSGKKEDKKLFLGLNFL
jgi:hypothetical protein